MRRLVALVSAVVLVDTMFFTAVTPLLPDYVDRLDLTKTSAGVLAGAYAAGALVGALPGGMAAARLGVRTALLIGLAGMIVSTFTFGFAETIWLLDAARFTQGVASSFAWAAGLAWLVAAAPRERRGELIGTAMGAAIFGALLGPVVGGVASEVGTELAFGAVAVFGTAVAAWAWTMEAPPPGERQPVSMLFGAVRESRVALGVWFVLLPALLFSVLSVLAPLRLDELGASALAIGATFAVAAGIEAVAAPLLGRLSDRRGRLLPLRAGLVASAIVAALIPLAGRSWVLAGLVVAAGISYGTFWAPGMSLLADGAEAYGLDYAYSFALIGLAWAPGAAAGAAAGGAVAEATSDALPYLVLSAACLVTFFVVTRAAFVARQLAAERP
jgi:MFS family permease